MFLAPSRILFGIAASVADATALNTYGIKVLSANAFSEFFVNVKPVFNNCPGSLPRITPDCIISDSLVFDNFILTNKLFAKLL